MNTLKPKIFLSALAALLVSGCGEPSTSHDPVESISPNVAAEHGEVSAATFKKHLENDRLVLLKFGAPWCGPCKKVDVELDKLAAANPDDLTICRINVDNDPELTEEYSVYGIPALFLFKDGEKVNDWEGYFEASEFQESIDAVK